jgi:secreted trypsin-like serine protease
MKKLIFLFLMIALAGAFYAPAEAINYGQKDVNNEYSWVGLTITPAEGGGFYICSGSLISPTVFLTAAHCTDNPAPYYVTFKPDGPYSLTNDFITGTAIPHPNWNGSLTVPNTSDVGVIILDEAQPGPYGELAPVGFIDELLVQRGTNDLGFTAVGYGLQNSQNEYSQRPMEAWDLARWYGFQRLMEMDSAYTDGYNIQLTNNPGEGNGSGGTCSGDSGGPIMHTETGLIVAVNSFGVAPYCKGNDYAFRVDIDYSRDFLNGYIQ